MSAGPVFAAVRRQLVPVAFLAAGLALVAGAGLAYYLTITRPLGWPAARARIITSRVVNPVNPGQYQPEIAIELRDGPDPRTVTVLSSWSSGAYDYVKAFVDRYPAGAEIEVRVNPADASDVRYELGPTRVNLLLPGVLALMGVIFGAVGAVAWWWPGPSSAPDAMARTWRRVAALFLGLGVGLGALGAWFWTAPTALDWPEVDATVVESGVIGVSSGSSRPSRAAFDIQVAFTFDAGGGRVTSRTTSGSSNSSRGAAETRLAAYAPGSTHRIRHRPDDPNVIRFEVTAFRERVLAGALLAMGIVFGGLGGILWRALRPRRRTRRAHGGPGPAATPN